MGSIAFLFSPLWVFCVLLVRVVLLVKVHQVGSIGLILEAFYGFLQTQSWVLGEPGAGPDPLRRTGMEGKLRRGDLK